MTAFLTTEPTVDLATETAVDAAETIALKTFMERNGNGVEPINNPSRRKVGKNMEADREAYKQTIR